MTDQAAPPAPWHTILMAETGKRIKEDDLPGWTWALTNRLGSIDHSEIGKAIQWAKMQADINVKKSSEIIANDLVYWVRKYRGAHATTASDGTYIQRAERRIMAARTAREVWHIICESKHGRVNSTLHGFASINRPELDIAAEQEKSLRGIAALYKDAIKDAKPKKEKKGRLPGDPVREGWKGTCAVCHRPTSEHEDLACVCSQCKKWVCRTCYRKSVRKCATCERASMPF